ncbi:MAG: hypothetical protein Q9180_004989 [Flavoplaca navasiana]
MRKDTIDSWFNHLGGRPRRSSSLHQFLSILKFNMLVADPARRARADVIHKSLKEVWRTTSNAHIADTQFRTGQSRDPPPGLRRILEIESLEFDKDSADVSNRNTEPRRKPHHVASSSQQTGTTDWEPRFGNRLDAPDTSRRMGTTNGPKARQEVEPAELCALLCDAARAGNVRMVQMRLDSLPSGTIVKNRDGRTPLSLAAESGATAVVGVLLRAGRLQIDGRDDSGRCALSWAAEHGRLEAVDVLVQIGKVDVNQQSKDYHGWTSLCCAAMNGHAQVVEYLLQSKDVEIDGSDAYGRTPLSWACDKGFIDVVRELLSTNMVCTTRSDLLRKSPRSRAVVNGHNDIVKLLDSYEKARRSFWRRTPKELRNRRRLQRTL